MIVPYADDQKLTQALSDGTVEAIVAPGLTMDSDAISITSIGGGDYYFVVTTKRIDLLSELNAAMAEIHEIIYLKSHHIFILCDMPAYSM